MSKAGRFKRRVVAIIILLVVAYLIIIFASLGYTNFVKLEKQLDTQLHENQSLIHKKQKINQDIQNSKSLEGQKDQMRKAGKYEPGEVPIMITDTDDASLQTVPQEQPEPAAGDTGNAAKAPSEDE